MQPTSLAVTLAACAPIAPALTLAADTRSVRSLLKRIPMTGSATVVASDAIECAKSLFRFGTSPDGGDYFSDALGCLGGHLMNSAFIRRGKDQDDATAKHWFSLSRAIDYNTSRLSDILLRLRQASWIHEERVRHEEGAGGAFGRFAELAIKDLHSDASSFMDSIGPTAVQVLQPLTPQLAKRLPVFADVNSYAGSDRAAGLLNLIPGPTRDVIDSTERWWPLVKRVRNRLLHRRHHTIVFGSASDGCLFQVYDDSNQAEVVDPVLAWPTGHNVVDFDAYATFVVAEILALRERLGKSMAEEMGVEIPDDILMIGGGDYSPLLSGMDALLERCV